MLMIFNNKLESTNHLNLSVSYHYALIYFCVEYQILDLSLLQIFEAVYVIEPAPYPVWEALILSFPKDHFMPIVKRVANSYADNSQ